MHKLVIRYEYFSDESHQREDGHDQQRVFVMLS